MEIHEQKTPARDALLRTIAVLGLIAVLLLGAWGIIQLAIALPSIFGSIGGGISSIFTKTPKETVTVSMPATISSGQTLAVNWSHTNKSGEYSYTLSYACLPAQNGQASLTLRAPLPNGSYQTIACNTPFNFVNASQKMSVVPTYTGSTPATLSVTVSATKLSTGAIAASGVGTTKITGQSVSTNTSTNSQAGQTGTTVPKPTRTSTSTYYRSGASRQNMYGDPDLAVHIINTWQNGSHISVQFEVINVGSNIVNSGWTFEARLPINGTYSYMSPPQQALYPGDKIVYNLGYDNYGNYHDQGYNHYQSGSVTITADPQGFVRESIKSNNTATITVPVW